MSTAMTMSALEREGEFYTDIWRRWYWYRPRDQAFCLVQTYVCEACGSYFVGKIRSDLIAPSQRSNVPGKDKNIAQPAVGEKEFGHLQRFSSTYRESQRREPFGSSTLRVVSHRKGYEDSK